MELDIQKILTTAVKYKASDVYISVGIKPSLRIHGQLIPIEEHPVLSKTMAQEYISAIMTDQQKEAFTKTLNCKIKNK